MPELNFGFNCLHIFKISTSDILENSKLTELLSARNVSNETSDSPISEARFGPI